MAISKKLFINGLVTYRNLSQQVEGALLEANNVVLDKPGVVFPRPGFSFTSTREYSSVLTKYPTNMDNFGGKLIYTTADNKIFTQTETLPATSITPSQLTVGPDTSISGSSYVEFAKGNKNLYGTNSNRGPWVWDGSGEVEASGIPKATTPTVQDSATLRIPAFAVGTEVAYRIVYGYRDDNNNLILGAPSERVTIVINAYQPGITWYAPTRLPTDTSSWFIQIYRTLVAAAPTVGNSGDTMYLLDEIPLSGAFGTLVDIYADSAMSSTFLYTNQNQETILQANQVAPVAATIEQYKNYMLYGNCSQPSSTIYTMTATPTVGATLTITSGLAPNFRDQMYEIANPSNTYTDLVLTAVAYPGPGIPHADRVFWVYSGGTTAQNIANTAKDLAQTIAYYAASGAVDASYASSSTDFPGKILIQSIYPEIGFTLKTTGTFPLNPSLSVKETFAPESYPNRVYVSKFQEPEAVPYSNYLDVGDSDDPILTIKTLRDSAFIIKKRSIWRLNGDTIEGFTLSLVTSTVTTLSAKTVKILGEYIYGVSPNGIYKLAGSSVSYVSDMVKDLASNLDETQVHAWVDEVENRYFLNLGTYDRILVYDVEKDVFFTWDLAKIAVAGMAYDGIHYIAAYLNPAEDTGGFLIQRGNMAYNESYGDSTQYSALKITSVVPVDPFVGVPPPPPPGGYTYVVTGTTPYDKLDLQALGVTKIGDPTRSFTIGGKISEFSFYAQSTATTNLTGYYSTNQLDRNYLLVSSHSGSTFTISATSGTGNGTRGMSLNPGDYLIETNGAGKAKILSKTSSTSLQVEILTTPSYTVPTAWVPYRGVTSAIEFWPFFGEGPEIYKDFREVAVISAVPPYGPMRLTYSTDLTNPQIYEEYQYASAPIGWGNFPWGSKPWGESGDLTEEVERSIAPITLDKGHKLKYKWEVSASRQLWELYGISIQYRNINFTSVRGGQ